MNEMWVNMQFIGNPNDFPSYEKWAKTFMDSREVCEMIDAITEGKGWTQSWDGGRESEDLVAAIDEGKFSMTFSGGSPEVFEVINPRTAREIAGALMAWANRKEGLPEPETHQGGVWRRPSNSLRNSGRLETDTSRAEWYKRNVGNMSLETMDRNLKDLIGIRGTLSGGSLEWEDVEAAIQILQKAGANNAETIGIEVDEDDPSTHEIGCTCFLCIPGV